MTNKITNSYQDLIELGLNQNKIIPPIQTNRTLNKLKPTDSLVASVEKVQVPNHTLNTKIYSKLQRNEIFEVSPVEVHFAGFEIKKEPNKYIQMLKIINISGQLQRMTVLPPTTKHFYIHYVKQERLVAGFALEIKVFFKPEEYKYYNDAIRIFSEGDQNLYVPIHAYPILSSFVFPTKYKFPDLPIGKSFTRSFNLKSTAPVEFEYVIEVIEKNSAFSIEPLEGKIPCDRDTIINVTFCPKDFCTAVMKVKLLVSQFNSKPIECTFYGVCSPGLARDELFNKYKKLSNINEKVKTVNEPKNNKVNQDFIDYSDNQSLNSKSMTVDSRLTSPNGRFASNQNLKSLKDISNQEDNKDVALKIEKYVDFDGYRVPVNLNTPWAISKVLTQTKGKLSLKELKSSSTKNIIKVSAQAKETLFLQKVTELEDEERRNQLKWQIKLGESTIDLETKEDILKSRARADYDYKLSIGVPFLNLEINRQKTIDCECRTVRNYTKIARYDVTFDTFKNQVWQLRFIAIDNFIQAIRKVIIKIRLTKVLKLIKKFIESWYEALKDSENAIEDIKLNIENYIEIYCKKMKGENLDQNEILKVIDKKSLGTFYFPQVIEHKELQDQKANHCEKLSSISKLESLGLVAVKPIEFQIQTEIPYLNLPVPIQHKVYSYTSIYESNFVPNHENRFLKLRTGAEDEFTQIDSTSIISTSKKENTSKKSESDLNLKNSTDYRSVSTKTISNEVKMTDTIDLIPSKQLYEPAEYNPLHIFNPLPGLMSYQKTLSYSGIDMNHHLNPLPRFEKEQTFSTQRKFLDRDDVIKGIMAWKKFPSLGLISLTNTATLTDLWVPRWSNTFGTDILPVETPPLLSLLPEDDKENLIDETEADNKSNSGRESKLYLTAEMVNAQFNIPDIFEPKENSTKEETQFPFSEKLPASNMPVSIHGQISRFQREQELEHYLNKQYNTLGLRIQNKLLSFEQQFYTIDRGSNNQINNNHQSNETTERLVSRIQHNQQIQQSNLNARSAATVSSTLFCNSATTIN